MVGVAAGRVRVVLTFTVRDGVITGLQLTADPEALAAFDLVLIEAD